MALGRPAILSDPHTMGQGGHVFLEQTRKRVGSLLSDVWQHYEFGAHTGALCLQKAWGAQSRHPAHTKSGHSGL